MDYEEHKREIKGDLDHLKHDLFSVENDDLIRIYEKEILNKSLEFAPQYKRANDLKIKIKS